ncbi:hypothetical protein [Winogradskya consettensis]|nr:hypothetical protein [Actinoplanes consettensis]
MIDMGRGGARNRSGPAPDPKSGRSDRRQYKLSALPAAGYDGETPAFPLPQVRVYIDFSDDGERKRKFDEDATKSRRERELELWAQVWKSPQACAWSMASWRWLSVAMWVRTFVLCESADATAADKNSLHRFADQVGMTPAGLKENGWAIVDDELSAKRSEQTFEDDPDDPRGRFTVIQGAG